MNKEMNTICTILESILNRKEKKNMENKIVFDVPIYSMNKEIYNDKLNKHVDKPGYDEISKQENRVQMSWKYNQIIGYIEISITDNDVYFNIYISNKQRIMPFSNSKHWIKLFDINNNHFKIEDNYTDKEIKEKIFQHLTDLEKTNILKNKCLNKENLYMQLKFINLENL